MGVVEVELAGLDRRAGGVERHVRGREELTDPGLLTPRRVAHPEEAVREAESKIRKAVTKGVFHHKTGSRYVSRLTLATNHIQAA